MISRGGFWFQDWLSSGTGVLLQRRTLARDFEEEEGEKGVVVVRAIAAELAELAVCFCFC